MTRVRATTLGVLLMIAMLLAACSTSTDQSSTTTGAGASSPSGPTLDRIKKTGTIRDCIDPEFPPEIYNDKSGNPTGLDIDLIQEMAKALNAKVEYVKTDFAGLIAGLQANKCDIELSGTTPRAKRALAATFAKDYLVAIVGAVVRGDYQKTTMAQLNDPSVRFCDQEATLAQFAQETYFPKAKAVNLKGADECFLQVLGGQADITITDSNVAFGFTTAHPQLKAILMENGGLAASPSAPAVQLGDYGFKFWIDVWLREFIDNGNYAPIYKKYFGVFPDIQQLLIQRGGL
jgi:ABC-type amino acid transport substrate-binding protein